MNPISSKTPVILVLCFICFGQDTVAQAPDGISLQVRTADGMLEGVYGSGIRSFKGIPFAQPPVGDLRWREPQPVKPWDGVRKATRFGPRAMQRPIYSDMNFRSDGVSEDCLYLNVWTPAKSEKEKLPVLVYFYGGGLMAGDGSEYRYDGESMARHGIVAVTVNYRLSVFGFFAHPELTRESPHHASGNYGLLDQTAALRWVRQNIAAFGGDPLRVTIAGESAGSFSVSAQMASPLARNLMAGAIGESGSLLGLQPPASLADAEKAGVQFATLLGAKSLADLRAMPASVILEGTAKAGVPRFSEILDGYFFPKPPAAIFDAGEQANVPLLVGWNSEEGNYRNILGQQPSTKANFTAAVRKLYPANAADMLANYDPATDADVEQVATDLASDRFIGFSTWKWSDVQSRTGGKPVFRYLYERPRPAQRDAKPSDPAPARGAVHSAEIEYAMGNLPTNRVFDWQPDDYLVSTIMQGYFVNFIVNANPNGLALPVWQPVKSGGPAEVMHINVNTRLETEKFRNRYLAIDKLRVK
ncbi:MAG: carboxylesterase family protein [Bacteroidota bacterium]|nr:carboxylesterase family protein [Bacteroidota bacterium]MDP4246011.1 carboxylesterase family protein [Bacteroidota bacterium]MDP4254975.1 carboxylesterase family protein [Bacteroidota bacterium]MDP4257792.1 carboxylesterase family protein [Bacteroidota bacterium]